MMQTSKLDDKAALLALWGPPHHLASRELPDGSVAALVQLFTTTAIVLGCHGFVYESRFCFADPALARQRFAELKSEDDEPAGYIARR